MTTLLEETLNLIRELDETNDPVKVAMLEMRIADRSDDLGELRGYAVLALGPRPYENPSEDDGELLVACLDEEQARAIQNALLTIEGGCVTTVIPVMACIEDFVHPLTPARDVATFLAHADDEDTE